MFRLAAAAIFSWRRERLPAAHRRVAVRRSLTITPRRRAAADGRRLERRDGDGAAEPARAIAQGHPRAAAIGVRLGARRRAGGGVVILGTTGEASGLSDLERARGIPAPAESASRVAY